MSMNRKAFYDAIRAKVGLTEQNVFGFERFLDYAEAHPLPLIRCAYVMATGYWESGRTMHPVKEAYWKDEAWRKRNLRYYPWYGRGLIQTTWEDNYRAIARAMGLPEDTFTKDPDKLLTFEYALPALFVGMEKGIYTGKDLDDYIDLQDEDDAEDLREYVAARRIVNGTDRAAAIGQLALVFEKGLKASGYSTQKPVVSVSERAPETPVEPTPAIVVAADPAPRVPTPSPPQRDPWWRRLLNLLKG